MQVILPMLYAFIFIFIIYKWKFFDVPSISKAAFVAVFILKIIAGTVLCWLYTYYYKAGDLTYYFIAGKSLFGVLCNEPKLFFQIVFNNASYSGLSGWNTSFEHILYNDARTMILLNTVLHFFSFGYFHVHTVFMCFISVLGLTALYKMFLPHFVNGKRLLFMFVFLIPSVLFWSSGVLKEGLLLFGMGTFLYTTDCGFATKFNVKKITAILFSVVILLLVKFYVLIALLPGYLLNIWISRTSTRLVAIKYATVLLICLCGVLLLSFINEDYNPLKIISEKQAKAISEAKGGAFLENEQHFICIEYDKKNEMLEALKDGNYSIKKGSSYLKWNQNNMRDTTYIVNSTDIEKYKLLYEVVPAKTALTLSPLEPRFISILINAPKAFLNVLIQPLFWKAKGFVQLLPALENVFFIGLLILTILFFNKKIENSSMIIFCFSFVLILYILIGITTPTIGGIIRYKVPALPFLCVGLLLLTDTKKDYP